MAKPAPAKARIERPAIITKDELRARVEKLETANAALRAKGREASRAAKIADARIVELEAEVARIERRASRGARRSAAREVDPGDAVPPGVAVAEPAPVDEEAEAVRDSLEERLGGE